VYKRQGGISGNTIVNKTEEQRKIIGNKISSVLSGKAKPEGFAEHLSDIRTGKGNPMAKILNPKIVVLKSSNDNSVIRSFDYVFEINQFLDDRYAGSNIVKQLKKRSYTISKGYIFRYIKDKDIEKLND
jgi:cytochrome b involved in lipid metabolism